MPVADSITIALTKEDLAEGEPGEPDRCPIAVWCKKMGFRAVSVGGNGADELVLDGVTYAMPTEALDFITDYDDWGEDKDDLDYPEPITFIVTKRAEETE